MKWISSAYIKILMKRNPLLQGNSEYELWKQTVEKVVDAMPSTDLELCEKCGRYRTKGRTCNIDEAPTIEPKHGAWEEKETFHNGDDDPIIEEWQSARCSVCHKYHTTPYMYYFSNYNFCPNCGASMREREGE